jgi:hypothetical protein
MGATIRVDDAYPGGQALDEQGLTVGADSFAVGVDDESAVGRRNRDARGSARLYFRMALLGSLREAHYEIDHVSAVQAIGHEEVEEAIVVHRLGRHEEGAAHALAVHDRQLGARLLDDAAVVLEAHLGSGGKHDESLERADHVGHEAVHVLELRCLEADDRVEADPDAVGEVPALGIIAARHPAHVHGPYGPRREDVDAGRQVARNVGSVGEVVASAYAEHAQRGKLVALLARQHHAIDDLVDGAVPASRHDYAVAPGARVPRELRRVPHRLRDPEVIVQALGIEQGLRLRNALGRRAFARRRVENNHALL